MLKRSIIAFWITIILGFYPSFAFAADIYVATPVTRTTINTAIASASPGDVVIIPDGTYNNLSNKGGRPITVAVSGTLGNEITLRAATPGGVAFTGTCHIKVDGNYWIIKDFIFENNISYSPSTVSTNPVLILGDYVTVTNCAFKNKTTAQDAYGGALIAFGDGADNDTLSYCTFENWDDIIAAKFNLADEYHIHHNYFSSNIGNHHSAIELGTDSLEVITNDTNSIVEYNYFDLLVGDEPEVISVKTSSVTFRYNHFYHSNSLVLRLGDDSTVESNYFFGDGTDNGPAVRIHGEGHKIINNYIEDNYTGIFIPSGGVLEPSTSGHVRAKNVQVLNNTIVNTIYWGILIGKWWPTEVYDPENLTFKNNIITQGAGYLVGYYGCRGTFTWENSLHYNQEKATYWIYGEAGTAEPNPGIVHATADLTRPVQPPISASDVGVSWMRGTTVQAPEQLRIEPSGL